MCINIIKISLKFRPANQQQCGKYKAISEHLVTAVADYANRPILDFLRCIAHNIQM